MARKSTVKRQRGYETSRIAVRRCGKARRDSAMEMHPIDVRRQSLAEFSVAKARIGKSRHSKGKAMFSYAEARHSTDLMGNGTAQLRWDWHSNSIVSL